MQMSLHLFSVPIRSIPSSKLGLPPQLTRKSVRCTRTRLRLQSSEMADKDSQQTSQRRSANYQPTAWNSDFIKSLKNHNVSPPPHLAQPPSQRRSANYQPTSWNSDFIKSLKIHNNNDEIQKQMAEKLKGEVRSMTDANSLTILELIDDIQRLGLSYHFEKDITRALDRMFLCVNGTNLWTQQKSTVHAIALCFKLCRQHGYEVSQDVFRRFKDENGNFIESISKDIKGLLSLYEASYFSFEGEKLMEEAKAFTTKHLKGKIANEDLVEQINHALEMPLQHRMLRLEARWYIEAYGKRKDANYLLLEMAKLEFNMVQSMLQGELKDMSRWWEDIGLGKRLSFIRDRLMECYFWNVGMIFEPKFSDCRKSLTKLAALVTTIDDVYDVYGSLDELELFTAAVHRWDTKAVETLPDYMKLCFLALYNTTNEMAYDILKRKGVNIIPHLKRAAESERGESANSILCYMHETGVSEQEARKHISSLIEEAWKKMNKERVVADSPFEKPFIETAFNLARIAQCTYQNGDGHGAPDNKAKNRVLSVIIEPITLACAKTSNMLASVS
ncbi:tricyclene synthase EBOS, chloroplastic-like isoform X3 [Rhododendron vialii]|uniref:tricyclene synthase EBOS, chloroplastic-like isoform X3 n=1 Tax=Rhododendron vialii TaxID=182163 RepID=UPI0026605951|nr:tricyclene synthase EBOS, chloroplastic-like isoform X3 [Rhododendron vialii]